jgi:NAD+ synthase (glutamine-hydrolysing)
VRPRDFDAKKKYPVIVDVYGGPKHLHVVQAMRNWLVPQWLADQGFGGVAVVTGYLDRHAGPPPRYGQPAEGAQNAAALLHGGRVLVTSAKHHLPNYGVFDEYRYFLPGDRLPVFRLPCGEPGQAEPAVDVATAVCEDLWQEGGPVTVTRRAGAGLLVVPNASPYEREKADTRLELCQRRAREAGAILAYVNMMGGQDELVFDGDSIIVDASGRLLARGPQFEEALVVADLDLPAADPGALPVDVAADAHDGTTMTIHRVSVPVDPTAPGDSAPTADSPGSGPGPVWPRLDPLAEVYAALVTGVRDYVRKNRFRSVILALSGGIDSALTATIAADA